jgi:pyridoxine 5-phosphate synthase
MNPLVASDAQPRSRTALSVNVNKIAWVRNTRALSIPNVVRLSEIALRAGAAGITVHPRPDERHIRAHDVYDLAKLLSAWPDREFNIEGNPFHQLMDFVTALRPHQCTFVPDESAQSTSDHGWNLPLDSTRLAPKIAEAKACGVRVSLFMDPVPEAMALVKALGADRVELYTETYASTFGTAEQDAVLDKFAATARAALEVGLGVNAGHDLNQENLELFLQRVPGVQEVSIGHALIADALEHGMSATVKSYLQCMR